MKCDHPNIVKLHQCFHDPKNLYFVMDCWSNGELFTYMKNEGVLDYKIAQFLAAEIVNMITYLQEHKICHRDLKPSNLILDGKMHLKLIDFGWGKFYKDKEVEAVEEVNLKSSSEDKEFKRMNTFIGTCEYMAPEIIQGIYVSNACDLWALGIMIYKFFAEFSPFMGEFDHETWEKIVEEDPKFPEGFPEDAKDICMKLLKKDPANRLGAGISGSENDTFALKSHKFFTGIDFENLFEAESPIPKTMRRLNSI